MKAFHYAIAASVTLASLVTFQVSARSIEPDYPCYIRTTSGRVINLDSLCKGQSTVTIEAQKITTVTLAQYNQVKNGMTYDQVAQLFRSPGDKISDSNETQGFKSTSYFWRNFDRSFASVDFSDGIVVSKVQRDLK